MDEGDVVSILVLGTFLLVVWVMFVDQPTLRNECEGLCNKNDLTYTGDLNYDRQGLWDDDYNIYCECFDNKGNLRQIKKGKGSRWR